MRASRVQLDEDDFRRHNPRFSGEACEQNLALVANLEDDRRRQGRARWPSSRSPGCSSRGDDVVPIPGTKRRQVAARERRGDSTSS